MAIDRDDFAQKMMRALRKAGVAGELRYNPERFAITRDGSSDEFFLASAHQLYLEASFWKRGGVVRHYAQTMFNAPESAIPSRFDEARGNLVPVVRNGAYLDVAELLSKTSAHAHDDRPPVQFRPVAGTLCYGLAYDHPRTLTLFSGQQLLDWGVTFDDAMKAARYNLSVRSRDTMAEVAPGLFMAPWQDANAAGRLILTELLTRLPVKGEVVACVPGRDFLFVTGSDDTDALGALVVAAEKAVAATKPNTPELFVLRGTEWTSFNLPPAHPLAARHGALVKGFIASDYEEQKKLIEELNDQLGADVYVAEYSAMRRNSGEVESWCTWAPCVSLLPRTDMIAIFDADAQPGGGKPAAMVTWDAAADVVGHKLKRQNDYRLERYLVDESPTELEMAELRKRAISG